MNGGILAGSLGRSLLKISKNSVQRVRNRDRRSSSPEKCMRGRISVFYHDLYRHHHREVLSRVVQTLELMTLVCVMFGLLLDSLIGILEGDLLGRFGRFATPP